MRLGVVGGRNCLKDKWLRLFLYPGITYTLKYMAKSSCDFML